jgi:hypothetical protein
MSKKIIWGIVGIVVLVGVFYGGMLYGKGQTSAAKTSGASAYAGARGARGAGGFGGATIGQILSENAQSITIALPSGGSEIVFLDNTTPITKQVNGTMSDLAVGTTVSVIGTANADGSVSAQSVQIRPAMAVKPSQ